MTAIQTDVRAGNWPIVVAQMGYTLEEQQNLANRIAEFQKENGKVTFFNPSAEQGYSQPPPSSQSFYLCSDQASLLVQLNQGNIWSPKSIATTVIDGDKRACAYAEDCSCDGEGECHYCEYGDDHCTVHYDYH